MSRCVLIVAYHFPPGRGSSGIQRTLKFCTYLQEHGWCPVVLTVTPGAFELVSDDQLGEIPADVHVERAFCVDTARTLSFRGRYFRWMAQPDRWVSWWPTGVWKGLRLIRRFRPKAIVSTFPIATAHLIGLTLHRLSGVPWVADFRDSMTEANWPRDPFTRRVHQKLERATMRHCSRAIFTTPGAAEMYAHRYPAVPRERLAIVENGFDEENFLDAEAGLPHSALGVAGQITLVHSGLLYPEDRDPRPFFEALGRLRSCKAIGPENLRVVLRAPGNDAYFADLLKGHGLEEIVHIEGAVAYRTALQEMLRADGLLLFQGPSCNHQIPAKLYEYLRAGRPIFALTDPRGNSAAVLRSAGVPDIVDIERTDSIEAAMREFLAAVRDGTRGGIPRAVAARFSRQARSSELAQVLNGVESA
jgi:glycosyltransferase involved in cell wall biosynthesis